MVIANNQNITTTQSSVMAEVKERAEYIRERYILNAKQNKEGFVVLEPWEKIDENTQKYFEALDYTIIRTKQGVIIVWGEKWKKEFYKDIKRKKLIYKISISIFITSLILLLCQLYLGINEIGNMIILCGIFYTGVLALMHCAIQYSDKIYITPLKEKE